MRIAIDARELEGKPTGVGRYLSNLLHRWLSSASGDDFILYHRGELARREWLAGDAVKLVRLADGILPFGVWWQQAVLARALRRDKPDVFFAPADSMPLRWRGPTILTFHDLAYEAYPEWFGRTEGVRRRWLARRSARRAAGIVAISNFTRSELRSRYDIPEDKIEVVYHGIDDSLRRAPFTPEDELRRKTELDMPFAIMIGSLFERRFPSQIIRAFRLLEDLDIGLVIAGDDRRQAGRDLLAEIRELGLEKKVRWLEYVSEEDLCGLYRAAGMLISLSLYEGFSLPPLEAMSFGLPAIVSGRGAQLEVYGDAAFSLAEETEENIALAIRSILTDAELRGDLIKRGNELAGRLTLDRCAERTLELIRKTGGASGG
ncbi:MAG TPA: glycosyltransferase family 1 protein [Acidobacteriota bacterium]|nr:glycosyltransferase family 1 protein [Acidobacteriota bacterium]